MNLQALYNDRIKVQNLTINTSIFRLDAKEINKALYMNIKVIFVSSLAYKHTCRYSEQMVKGCNLMGFNNRFYLWYAKKGVV